MKDPASLVVFTTLLIIAGAGFLWLFTAIGVPQPINLIATAVSCVAIGINM